MLTLRAIAWFLLLAFIAIYIIPRVIAKHYSRFGDRLVAKLDRDRLRIKAEVERLPSKKGRPLRK